MTDEHRGTSGLGGGLDVDCVEQIFAARDGVLRGGDAGRRVAPGWDSSQEPIAQMDHAVGDGERDGE